MGWGCVRQTVEKHGEQMWREELPRGQHQGGAWILWAESKDVLLGIVMGTR